MPAGAASCAVNTRRSPTLRFPGRTSRRGAPASSSLPGAIKPELVEAAFERHHLMFLPEWAPQDPKRAAEIALRAEDSARRRAGLALVLPEYAKRDPAQTEAWLRELAAAPENAQTSGDLAFLTALARARFALGHTDEARRTAATAMSLGKLFAAKRDKEKPVYSFDGASELHDLAQSWGEFQPDDLAAFSSLASTPDESVRLFLMAAAVRGALRHRPGYREPI